MSTCLFQQKIVHGIRGMLHGMTYAKNVERQALISPQFQDPKKCMPTQRLVEPVRLKNQNSLNVSLISGRRKHAKWVMNLYALLNLENLYSNLFYPLRFFNESNHIYLRRFCRMWRRLRWSPGKHEFFRRGTNFYKTLFGRL